MTRRLRARRGAALLAAAIAAAGCGEEICLEWDRSQGDCPGRLDLDAALRCAGTDVESVDSEGTFDEGACCYEVTKRDDDFFVTPPSCFEPPEPAPGDDGAE